MFIMMMMMMMMMIGPVTVTPVLPAGALPNVRSESSSIAISAPAVGVSLIIFANLHLSPMGKIENSFSQRVPKELNGVSVQATEEHIKRAEHKNRDEFCKIIRSLF
ncbi:uncharacterized protein [Rutidosis leptorrhynchoides]|uniref:uncharacterized protein n=1 Tax=Rutidosis leptorrhynchoides TaxID=125765 RepID=UPI003A99BDEB